MQYLVAGGAGFIGSEFVRQLARDNHSNICVIDSLTYAGHLENLDSCKSDLIFAKCDISDKDSLKSVLRGFNPSEKVTLVNFAAESHVDRSILSSQDFVRTNVLGTANLLDVALEGEFHKFIQISTDEVYGPTPDGVEFKENAAHNPTSPYAASKAAAEQIVSSYQKTFGLNTVITRACNNFGPFQMPEKLIPRMIMRGLLGMTLPIYGTGLQTREWIDASMHAEAIRIIAESDNIHREYNIGSGFRITNLGLATMVEEILGFETSQIEFVGDRLAHDKAYAVDSSRWSTEFGINLNYDFFKQLSKTVEWYKSNLYNWSPLKTEQFAESEEIYKVHK
jgi:dTDP-glucose 4,6-dehydratase